MICMCEGDSYSNVQLFTQYLTLGEPTGQIVLFSYNLNEIWNPVYANATSAEFEGRRLFFETAVR